MNFDDLSPEVNELKSDNNQFIIDSLEKSINSQELYLSELNKVEDKSETILNSIKETEKVLRINRNLLDEITIINNKEFSLKPVFNILSPERKTVKAYRKYSNRTHVDFSKAVERLGRNKKYKFHHPEHIALALTNLEYDLQKSDKVLGILCLFFTSVSIRTHAAYIRYINGYFAGIFTLFKRIETIEKYEQEGFPPDTDSAKLIQYKKDMQKEIQNKRQVIFNELDSLLDYLQI